MQAFPDVKIAVLDLKLDSFIIFFWTMMFELMKKLHLQTSFKKTGVFQVFLLKNL